MGESLAVAASAQHPLARARRATLRQLGEQRWVLAHAGSNTRRQFDNAFIAAGLISPRPDIESLSFHTNMHLVAGSDLLTLAPASAVADYERLGLVRRVRTDVEFPSGMLTFLALQSHPSLPALEALRAALLEDAGVRAGLAVNSSTDCWCDQAQGCGFLVAKGGDRAGQGLIDCRRASGSQVGYLSQVFAGRGSMPHWTA